MDRLGDSRLSRMLQLALCQEPNTMTVSRQYCESLLVTSTTKSHFQVRHNCVEVCQRHRSDISMRALCPHGGCPWSLTIAVRVNSLHSTASSSDFYWTAELRVQRSNSVEQSATSLARKHVTKWQRCEYHHQIF